MFLCSKQLVRCTFLANQYTRANLVTNPTCKGSMKQRNDSDILERYMSYGYILMRFNSVDGIKAFSISSDVFRWKLRDIRVRLWQQSYTNDDQFIRDIDMLNRCVLSNTSLHEKTTQELDKAVAFLGLFLHPLRKESDFQALARTVTFSREDYKPHDVQCPISATKNLKTFLHNPGNRFLSDHIQESCIKKWKTATSIFMKTSTPKKRKKSMMTMTNKTTPPLKRSRPGRPFLVGLEPRILDPVALSRLKLLRELVKENMCPHLEGQDVSCYSRKRERLVSEKALGRLEGMFS
jgi:hypothetical protein